MVCMASDSIRVSQDGATKISLSEHDLQGSVNRKIATTWNRRHHQALVLGSVVLYAYIAHKLLRDPCPNSGSYTSKYRLRRTHSHLNVLMYVRSKAHR